MKKLNSNSDSRKQRCKLMNSGLRTQYCDVACIAIDPDKLEAFVWTIFKNIAPLFALMIVVGIVFGAMRIAGVFEGSTLQQSAQQTQSVYSQVSGKVTSVIGVLSDWLSKYFSFAFAKSTYGLTVFLIVFFSVVALVDKFFLMPMMRKRV